MDRALKDGVPEQKKCQRCEKLATWEEADVCLIDNCPLDHPQVWRPMTSSSPAPGK